MKPILILLLTTLTLIANGQIVSGYEGFMVIDSDGVLMREGPGTEYPIVKSIPFGEVLNRPQQRKYGGKETINGLEDTWEHLKYESSEGYVFGAYISQNAQPRNPKFPKGYPQFFEPELGCGTFLFFDKTLEWHAVHENAYNEDQFDITPVELDFQVVSNQNSYGDESDYYVSPYLQIVPDKELKVIYYLGLPRKIEKRFLRKTALPVRPMAKSGKPEPRSLLPGDIISLNNWKKIYCFGEVSEVQEKDFDHHGGRMFEKYAVKVVTLGGEEPKYEILGLSPSDEITFVGDLNDDAIKDIIVTHIPGWSVAKFKLFMSGYEDKVLTEVALNHWGGCH